MQYRNTKEFPQWVLDFHETQEYMGNNDCYPSGFQEIVDSLKIKAEQVATEWRNKPRNHPYQQEEIDAHMRAKSEYWERYPVFCCNEGFRPDDWDFLHDSEQIRNFSCCGGLYETKIGNWYFVLGFDHD